MTTIDKQTFHVNEPKYLTDEYEVVRDGRTLRCRRFEYRGDEYESCYEVGATVEMFRELIPEPIVGPDDPCFDELVAYMDQFLIERDEPTPE